MPSVLKRISAPQRFKMSVIIKPMISDAERVERQSAVDYSRASVRLEGYITTPEYEALDVQFVDGKLTLDQYMAAVDVLVADQLEAARKTES
jgi:Antitoxin VbhA